MIIYQILKDYRRYKKFTEDKDDSLLKIYTSPKNFNGEYGLSLSILGIEEYSPTVFGLLKNLFLAFWIAFFGKKKYDIIILEYGIDHPGEMDFLLDIAKPHISITTSVDKVHSQFFPSFDALFKEKAKLALNTREVAFLNYNNPFTRKIYPLVKVDKFLFTVSDYKEEDDVKPDIWFSNYQIKAEKSNIY
jgi:UDP-N-acetylmuramyl pentapeptide synthase